MSNKIPTAEEFIQNYNMEYKDDKSPLVHVLKDFAQFHVEAALKAASKVELDDVSLMPEGNDFEESREKSILNAYPKEKII